MELVLDPPMSTHSLTIPFGAHHTTANKIMRFIALVVLPQTLTGPHADHLQSRPRFLVANPNRIGQDQIGARFQAAMTSFDGFIAVPTQSLKVGFQCLAQA